MENLIGTFVFKGGKYVTEKLNQKVYFSCVRCSKLCCRLGGPKLSRDEVKAISALGYSKNDFVTKGKLASKPNGECVFLGKEWGKYHCGIYDARPKLCRIFPFIVKKTRNKIQLGFMPCAGINNPSGELVDADFVNRHIAKLII